MKELSIEAQQWLQVIGNFEPTINTADCLMKGWSMDEDGYPCKTYYNNEDFRSMSHAANEIADWLEERADQ